ncbi:hypothetical protein BGZ63DRAFT_398985 [Mariannaea sp. PMI_226]|nr:hypothetical protein BGZ63DRAFT_398985 [Mariannaea sp. PMI_226]
MAAASRDCRLRPPIQPISTTGPEHRFQALCTEVAFKSPSRLATPHSPMTRPLPMYPDFDDDWIKNHDKAAVDRLEPRSRRNSPNPETTPRDLTLKPISERGLASPFALFAQRPPLTAPLLPPPTFHVPTIAEETRYMLLHDAEQSGLAPPPHVRGRRGSAPSRLLRARNLQLQRQREYLSHRGLDSPYMGRAADLLVIPVELRGQAASPVHGDDGDMRSRFPEEGRLTTRVVIHSRSRKPLALTRTFDLRELRATIPDVVVETPGFPTGRRRASISGIQGLTPMVGTSPRTLLSHVFYRDTRNLSARAPNFESPRSDNRVRRLPFAAVPMHLEYARKYLPVLASIILSDFVRPGDTIELPLPHPRAWEETVAYTRTGRVELTQPVRQNIIYLGGKV